MTADSRAQITAARDAVVSGKRLAQAMTLVTALKPETIQMIAIGEETNRLEPCSATSPRPSRKPASAMSNG